MKCIYGSNGTKNSCRYDLFFFLYSFIIYPHLLDRTLTPNIDIINYFQKLSGNALKATNEG